GGGIEFKDFRKYTFEDDASDIDWRASLKSDETLVREYESYKTLNIYILVDLSDSMLFTSEEKLKAEYAAELAYDLCDVLVEGDEAVGFASFTDRIDTLIRPTMGKDMMPRVRKRLNDTDFYGGKGDIGDVLKLMRATARQPALVILITDFISVSDEWERYLAMVAEEVHTLGIMLRDPRDSQLPREPAQYILQDTERQTSVIADTKALRQQYKQVTQQHEEHVEQMFKEYAIGFTKAFTGSRMYPTLTHFFRRIARAGA
ncbi:MAG: DUF58 domain-containing protein, partial [Halobacteriaceae archaeon]